MRKTLPYFVALMRPLLIELHTAWRVVSRKLAVCVIVSRSGRSGFLGIERHLIALAGIHSMES